MKIDLSIHIHETLKKKIKSKAICKARNYNVENQRKKSKKNKNISLGLPIECFDVPIYCNNLKMTFFSKGWNISTCNKF